MSLLDTKLAEHQERGASSVLLSVCTHLGRLSHMSVHLALIAGLALWKRKGRLKKGDSRSRFKKLSVQWQWVLLTLPGSSLASRSQRWPSVLKGCSTGQTLKILCSLHSNDHSQLWGFGVYVMFMSLSGSLAFRILINIHLCLPVEIKKCVCVCPHILYLAWHLPSSPAC